MEAFFSALWPHVREEQLILTGFGDIGKPHRVPVVVHHEVIGLPLATELSLELDWYFGVASRDLDFAEGLKLGDAKCCRFATCLYLDIDFPKDGHHKAKNLPLDYQAREMLEEAGLPEMSAIIHTGGGWHVYWFLDQPYDVRVGGPWYNALKGLQQKCNRIWTRHGFHLDNTIKIPQILRVPGTKNWKTSVGVDVHTLLLESSRVYPLTQFKAEPGRPKKSSPETDGLHHRKSSTPLAARAASRGRAVSGEDFFERLKDDLLAGPHAELFELVFAGKRFAEAERDNTLQALCSRVAFAGRRLSKKHATVETLLHVFDATMAAYVDDEWSLEENLEWAASKLERALVDADIKVSATEEQDARLWAWFERHTEKSENVVFKKGDAGELSVWLASLEPPKVFDRGTLHEFDEDAWVPIPRDQAYRDIVDLFQDRMVQREGTTAKGEPFAPKEILLEDSKVKGIYSQLTARVSTPGFFDDAPHGYAFKNGFVTVQDKSIVLVPHCAENRNIGKPFLTYIPDPLPLLDPWFDYLDGLGLPLDTQVLVNEIIGIAMLGLAPTYKKSLSLLGSGDNGKSVFINFIASLFFPDRTSQISPHRWGSRFGSMGLANSLLNYVEEVPTARIEATDVFKKIIGGSKISTDVKHGSEFSFIPRAAHIFAFNELPLEAADLSDGWWTRQLLIPFPKQFTAADKNPHQLEKLAPLRDAVASYCIQQAEFVLQNRGYTISDALAAAVAEWRFKSDPIALFIVTKLEVSFEAKLQTEEVYLSYRGWCTQTHQVKPVAQETFREALAKHFKISEPGHSKWPVRIRPFAGISNAPSNGHYPPLSVVPPSF